MNQKVIDSFVVAIIATCLSYTLIGVLGIIAMSPWMTALEAVAVLTSYSCTYLCTVQTRWNYPIGVLTTAVWSLLFFLQGLPALAVFNLYLVFSLAYGWFRWGPDRTTRPVTSVKPLDWLFYAGIGLAITGLFLVANWLFMPGMTFMAATASLSKIDILLAAMSGVAQLQLDNKKIENWYIWIAVDLISIPYFWFIGMPATSIQYLAFLANAVWACFEWKKPTLFSKELNGVR
jgi:nicotinamide mononucleotide transporter